MNVLRMPFELTQIPQIFVLREDFFNYTTAGLFTTVVSDSGTIAVSDAVGGVVTLTPSDGSVADNDEAYLKSTTEVFLPAAGKPAYFEGMIQFTEANTSAANVAFGVANAVAANLIVDDGGGLRTSGTILAIYKIDGETVWRCVSRNSGASEVTVSVSTATAGGAAYQTLSIEVLDVIGTYATVVFKVDGALLIDATTGVAIKHRITLASQTEAQMFVGVKNGSTSLETVLVDYLIAAQQRI